MNLQKIFEAAHFQISGGSEYNWDCFGPNVHLIDFMFNPHDMFSNNATVTFDRLSQVVYILEVYFTGVRDEKDVAFRWINPNWKEAYFTTIEASGMGVKEAYDGVEFIDKDNDNEILELLELSMTHNRSEELANKLKVYIETCQLDIDIDKEQLFELMLCAHRRDITLNELMTEVLQAAVEEAQVVINQYDNILKDTTKLVTVKNFVLLGKIYNLKKSDEDGKDIIIVENEDGDWVFMIVDGNVYIFNGNKHEFNGNIYQDSNDRWVFKLVFNAPKDEPNELLFYTFLNDFYSGVIEIVRQLLTDGFIKVTYLKNEKFSK